MPPIIGSGRREGAGGGGEADGDWEGSCRGEDWLEKEPEWMGGSDCVDCSGVGLDRPAMCCCCCCCCTEATDWPGSSAKLGAAEEGREEKEGRRDGGGRLNTEEGGTEGGVIDCLCCSPLLLTDSSAGDADVKGEEEEEWRCLVEVAISPPPALCCFCSCVMNEMASDRICVFSTLDLRSPIISSSRSVSNCTQTQQQTAAER